MSPWNKRWWLLPVFVALGLSCLFLLGSKLGSSVNTETGRPVASEGQILVIPLQIERDNYGLAMVDTLNQTLWIYEINNRGPAHNRLKLLAARSWQYDRLLKDLNSAEPKPEKVRMILENIGQLPQKTFEKRQQDSKTSILEIAEPNNKDSGG